MNEILQRCRRLLPEMEHLTKMNKNKKLKMAAAAILNFIYCSYLVYYCTQLHEICHDNEIWLFAV